MAGMIKAKRAIYLTLIVIMVMSLFILFLSLNQKLSFNNAYKLKSERVEQINALINDINIDAERALYIAGYRGASVGMMEALQKYNSQGFDDYDQVIAAYKEIMISGTANSNVLESMIAGPTKQTLTQWVQNLGNRLLELNLNLKVNGNEIGTSVPSGTLPPGDLAISYKSPFEINLVWDVTFLIEDSNDAALKWNLEETYRTTVPIEGFEDPLYRIGSSFRYSNFIYKTPYVTFINAGNTLNDVNLRDHIKNQFYTAAAQKSPSYFQRFIKRSALTAYDANGIESFVFIPGLLPQDQKDEISLDRVYFGYPGTTGAKMIVKDLGYSWFSLDQDIALRYGLETLLCSPGTPGCP